MIVTLLLAPRSHSNHRQSMHCSCCLSWTWHHSPARPIHILHSMGMPLRELPLPVSHTPQFPSPWTFLHKHT